MREAIEELKRHLVEAADLESVSRLLEWDECVYMPPRSASAHTRQKATLTRLAHEKFTSAAVGRLLDRLAAPAEELPYESDDASLVRVARREYQRAVRVPPQFVTRLEEYKSDCYDAWYRAREENDFSKVAPSLKRGIDLSRDYAGFFPGYRHIADPLIENHDCGITVDSLSGIFHQLRDRLIPLVSAIAGEAPPDDSFLYRKYPRIKQIRLGQRVIERCGFDFTRGRQDLSRHPFATNMSPDDVRITTHVNEHSFFDSFSSTMHEAGHAIYDQAIPRRFEGLPVGKVASMAMHESQARLWENLIGRSRHFWGYFFPVVKAVFAEQLEGVTLEEFYRAVNRVKPTLIRTEADEVTYNLHVMIRFDLEVELLEGTLSVDELPEAWEARYRADLGMAPENHSEGVLQDVHWYCDIFGGGFQGYALGNIISALCFDSATRVQPRIVHEMEGGEFTSLLSWLNGNIYSHGSKFTAAELIRSFSGKPLAVEPYLRYLYSKYGALYNLDLMPRGSLAADGGEPCATSMTC